MNARRDHGYEKTFALKSETTEERTKRILRDMPAKIFSDPKLRLQALRNAQSNLRAGKEGA